MVKYFKIVATLTFCHSEDKEHNLSNQMVEEVVSLTACRHWQGGTEPVLLLELSE